MKTQQLRIERDGDIIYLLSDKLPTKGQWVLSLYEDESYFKPFIMETTHTHDEMVKYGYDPEYHKLIVATNHHELASWSQIRNKEYNYLMATQEGTCLDTVLAPLDDAGDIIFTGRYINLLIQSLISKPRITITIEGDPGSGKMYIAQEIASTIFGSAEVTLVDLVEGEEIPKYHNQILILVQEPNTEPMVERIYLTVVQNSHDWNFQHRKGLEESLMIIESITGADEDVYKIANQALKKHSIKFLNKKGLNILENLEPFVKK